MRLCTCSPSKSSCEEKPGKDHYPMNNFCKEVWSWDILSKSHEVRLLGAELKTALFHPGWSNGTAGIRGKKKLDRSTICYWEIEVSHRVFGTSLMFGIGTESASVHASWFTNLLGQDVHSYGLSHKGQLWHNGHSTNFVDAFHENVATVVGIYFNGPQRTLRFYKDGQDLGPAFTDLDLKGQIWYPMVASTAARSEMTLGVRKRPFASLQDRCLSVLAECVDRSSDKRRKIDDLPLPDAMKVEVRSRTTGCVA